MPPDSNDDGLAGQLRPWPPSQRTPALDAVRAVYDLRTRLDDEALEELFTDDVVVTPPPMLAVGAFRPYFGIAGLRALLAERERHWPGLRPVAERYLDAGEHVAILGRLVMTDREVEASWLWSVRDGRISAVRTFRYPSEALVRLAALAGDDGVGG